MITFGARISYRSEQQFIPGANPVRNSNLEVSGSPTAHQEELLEAVRANSPLATILRFLNEKGIPFRLFEFGTVQPSGSEEHPDTMDIQNQRIEMYTGDDAYSKEAMALDAFPLSATTGLFVLHRGNLTQ